MKMKIEQIALPYKTPFEITGYTFHAANTVRITLEDNGLVGRGEALGIYYKNETMESLAAQLESVVDEIANGITRDAAQHLLPVGGARNALDCALWDLEAKRQAKPIWDILNITPKPISTVYTLGIASPEAMGRAASEASRFPNLKIKLSNEDPIARLEATRAARPDAKLIIDVNQGWSFDELKEYLPMAQQLDIAMIEQPLPRGADEQLEGFKSPIPLGADESCLNTDEYETAARRYDVINIKLDKCGGLTEGLKIVELAKNDGKGLMVGNMGGSSLSMAPGFVIGQFCQFVDIDGPLLLDQDIENALDYGDGGMVGIPEPTLWG
jgi:L-Ala-D/L-Glu epimerase / N-acetyl-D-glutamate racemase